MTIQPLQEWEPESIGEYRLTGRLGAGGFGTVFSGVDEDGRAVAVKMLRPELAADQGLRDRLAREGEAMRRVASKHTVDVVEVVTEGASAYLVMELDPGCDVGDEVLHSAAEAETARSAPDAAPVVERRDRHADQFGKFFGRDHVRNEWIRTGKGRVASVGGFNHEKPIKSR